METLQIIFETITGNIFYMILAVSLTILIGYGIVKKLFKLVVVMGICLAIYIGYIYWTGGSDAVQDTLEDVKKGLDVFKEDIEKSLDNINNIQP